MDKTTFFFRNSIFLLFILFSNSAVCQTSSLKEIDDLLQKAESSRRKFKNLDQLEYAKKASILAEKSENSQKIAESYYRIAEALFFLELQKQSLSYINKASQQPYTKSSKLLQAQLKEVKAFNYLSLGLNSQFNRELPEIINLLKDQKDEGSLKLLQRTYLNVGASKQDSALYYSKLCSEILKKIPQKDIHLELSDLYKYLGTDFLDKKSDSALFYFKKSLFINQKYNDPILFQDYTNFGDYFFAKEQYPQAIDYYKKAIQNIKDQSIAPYHFLNNEIYRKISDSYGKLGDIKQQNEYKNKYSELQKKLISQRAKNIEYALNVILKDKNDEFISSQNKSYLFILIGILVLIITLFLIYRLLTKNIRYKETILSEANTVLKQKDELISQKSIETVELQQKVNDAYSEVIKLAKNNDPSFYFRFQEVYPEFQKKLLQVSPGLRTSELILCAYTFLGFTIKDIADYTYKSSNTIRNRKQNLRKKFSIPTEQDMGNWLNNLIK